MRGLENALARMARRDELRERAGGTPSSSVPPSSSPGASPVVDEVAEALRAVVQRNPGVFATVVVQEADTAWSVWIGEWDGTLRTRVTQLDPDPPVSGESADLDLLDQPTQPLALPGALSSDAPLSDAPLSGALLSGPPLSGAPLSAVPPGAPLSAVSAPAPLSVVPEPADGPGSHEPTAPITPLPRRRRRPVSAVSRAAAALPAGPTRRTGDASVSELLQPRRPAPDAADSDTPPLGVRPLVARSADAPIPLPGQSDHVDPNSPLPKRIPDSGIPLPKRRPALPSSTAPDELLQPALPAPRSGLPARPLRLPVEAALPAAPTRLPTQPGPARRAAAQAGLASFAAAQSGQAPTRPGLAGHAPTRPGLASHAPPPGPAGQTPTRSGPAGAGERSDPAGVTAPVPARPAPLPPPQVPLTAAASRSLPVPPAAAGPAALPPVAEATWPPLTPSAQYRPAHLADQPTPAGGTPALPVPTIPAPPLAAAQRVSGPAMNDRVAGRIADMLRREAKRDNRGLTS